ncbi:ABC transporter substrate-binding protein [Cohnella silvisoli]|uniref:Thiamine pyrimidine synthase n=1 Tax=Cohnella silvisoli TaxID=2873699 RepID=A0ABV1KZ67_9BACL|nr:ABC transporter substrate-binding protein [Cohnella silvisoli]MCD9024691.1 ABC transporter substrate-binding protein [Cohnella silvisoli]
MLTNRKRKNAVGALLLIVVLILVTAGCGGGNSNSSESSSPTSSASVASPSASSSSSSSPSDGTPTGIDWAARKEANKAAGKIRYTTGYYFAASSPDVQAVMADELGYFKELGLDVDIQPGLDSQGMKFLAAGQAQFSSAGNPSLVITSVESGAEIKGVATFGSVGVNALMVMEDSDIHSPKDLVGKTLGYKGAIPSYVISMLNSEGVTRDQIKAVSVGYDPRILDGKVDALTVYKTNEPFIMQKAGYKVRLIDPGEFGGETSFGVVAVNSKFASEFPTAVEDFLRALSKAHEYALQHPEETLKAMQSRSEAGYDLEAETNRWAVESKLVQDHLPEGHGVAWQTDVQWQREVDMLVKAEVIKAALPLDRVMDNSFINSIYDGTTLIWPK